MEIQRALPRVRPLLEVWDVAVNPNFVKASVIGTRFVFDGRNDSLKVVATRLESEQSRSRRLVQ